MYITGFAANSHMGSGLCTCVPYLILRVLPMQVSGIVYVNIMFTAKGNSPISMRARWVYRECEWQRLGFLEKYNWCSVLVC